MSFVFNQAHERPCCRWSPDGVGAGSGCVCYCHERDADRAEVAVDRYIVEAAGDQAVAVDNEVRVVAASGAVKADGGKPRLDLIPVDALLDVAAVLTFGANKYEPRNWERGFPYGRLYGATLRHMLAWWKGETNDPETGLSHLAHAATNILFLLEYAHTGAGEDDRP